MAGTETKRRLPPGAGSKLFGAGASVLLAVAFPVVAFVVFSGDDNSATVQIIAVVFGVFCLTVAYSAYRKVFAPRAKHLRLTVPPERARRGGEIQARLEVLNADDVGERVEVGLVCTEYYDIWKQNVASSGSSSRYRETQEAIAHEEWRPADRAQRLQTMTFTVPSGAPFSYRGSCLSFEWQLSVREPRRMRFDRREIVTVEVAP